MNFDIGDLVTRKSYNNDLVFEITDIIDGICYLKGSNIRLCADSPIEDLNKYENGDDSEEKAFVERSKPKLDLDRTDYFYLPGKILHIDGDSENARGGTFFNFPLNTHPFGVERLLVIGARFELRNRNSKLIHCEWNKGNVSFCLLIAEMISDKPSPCFKLALIT